MSDPSRIYPTPRSRQSSDADGGGALGSSGEASRDPEGVPKTARDPITVALFEDNHLVRDALTRFLSRNPDIRVIGGDPERHASILREMDPGVVLLHLDVENGDSLRLATQILHDVPDARVIVMDFHPTCETLSEFVMAGVSGFVMKDATMEDVLGTIRAVAAGLKVLPDEVTDTLFSEIAEETLTNRGTRDPASGRLTPREQEVGDLIAEGRSNKAIAKELGISIHTVKSHLRNMMDKLAASSRLQVAKYVHEQAARAESPAPDRAPKGGTPPAGPTEAPVVRRTVSRSGTGAPGMHPRPRRGGRGFGPSRGVVSPERASWS